MSNVAIRNILPLAACSFLVAGCAGPGDTEKARMLLDQAESAVETHDYSRAIMLTDSIRSAYPGEIEVRKEALHVRSLATEGLNLRRLESADSLLAVLGARGDSLTRLIKFVPNPVEGYYIGASADPSAVGSITGLQARISPDGDFYIISTLKNKSVRSTSITVSSGNAVVSTPDVAHDGERNDRSMGAEIITFMGVECDSVGQFIYEKRSSPITLTFSGSSTYSMSLPRGIAEEIATLYDYASTLRQARIASLEKEKLSRAVDIARSQSARTYVGTDSL